MAAVSVSTARALTKQAPALVEWGKAMAAGGGAFLLYYYRGHAPWFFTFFVANALVLAISHCGLIAHVKLLGGEQRVRFALVVSTLGMSGVLASYFWDVSRQAAVFTVSAATALNWAATSASIFQAMRKRTTPAALAAIVTFAFMSSVFAVRALAALGSEGTSISPNSSATPQVGLLVLGAMFMAASSINFFVMAHDRRRHEVEEDARRDGLTGIYNRAAFFQLAQELDADINARPYALVMFDIDHFKSINDTHGHGGGDIALAHAARLIAGLARISDVVGRYGGEEFCVLLQDGGEQEASLFARRVVAEAEKQTVRLAEGRTTTYTFSAGYAAKSVSMRADGTPESISDVVERADRALYQAKGAGRNQAVAAQLPVAAAATPG